MLEEEEEFNRQKEEDRRMRQLDHEMQMNSLKKDYQDQKKRI